MLRFACVFFILVGTVFLSPLFALNCTDNGKSNWEKDGHDPASCPAGYVGSCLYIIITMTL